MSDTTRSVMESSSRGFASAGPAEAAPVVCPYCGPKCYGGAEHWARVEDGNFAFTPPASADDLHVIAVSDHDSPGIHEPVHPIAIQSVTIPASTPDGLQVEITYGGIIFRGPVSWTLLAQRRSAGCIELELPRQQHAEFLKDLVRLGWIAQSAAKLIEEAFPGSALVLLNHEQLALLWALGVRL